LAWIVNQRFRASPDRHIHRFGVNELGVMSYQTSCHIDFLPVFDVSISSMTSRLSSQLIAMSLRAPFNCREPEKGGKGQTQPLNIVTAFQEPTVMRQ
jgi:hypothetical protein